MVHLIDYNSILKTNPESDSFLSQEFSMFSELRAHDYGESCTKERLNKHSTSDVEFAPYKVKCIEDHVYASLCSTFKSHYSYVPIVKNWQVNYDSKFRETDRRKDILKMYTAFKDSSSWLEDLKMFDEDK